MSEQQVLPPITNQIGWKRCGAPCKNGNLIGASVPM